MRPGSSPAACSAAARAAPGVPRRASKRADEHERAREQALWQSCRSHYRINRSGRIELPRGSETGNWSRRRYRRTTSAPSPIETRIAPGSWKPRTMRAPRPITLDSNLVPTKRSSRVRQHDRVLDLGALDGHAGADRGVRPHVGVDEARPGSDDDGAAQQRPFDPRRRMHLDRALDLAAFERRRRGIRQESFEHPPVAFEQRLEVAVARQAAVDGLHPNAPASGAHFRDRLAPSGVAQRIETARGLSRYPGVVTTLAAGCERRSARASSSSRANAEMCACMRSRSSASPCWTSTGSSPRNSRASASAPPRPRVACHSA